VTEYSDDPITGVRDLDARIHAVLNANPEMDDLAVLDQMGISMSTDMSWLLSLIFELWEDPDIDPATDFGIVAFAWCGENE
jgi:hypothetical protein